jgi:choline dehydrogenase-like flavoprotein
MILRYQDYQRVARLDADVIVIGTGAGGAAAGAELAEAGFDVLFVEEGSYNPTSSFSPTSTESVPRLYRDAGATAILGRPPIPYLEGRTVGGTTVLNGGMTYRPPDDVLASWETITGSPDMGPAGLEPLLERAERSVHADRQLDVSVGNDSRLMARGAQKLGWKVEVNRRNQVACVGANNCVFGCPTGAKQSTLVSYLPRAVRHGARIATEIRVDRLLIEGGRCVGASGRSVNPATRRPETRIELHAPITIVACGAVQTPFLLKRHGVGRPSRQLGRNFLCHPNAKVVAIYPHVVNAWQGVSQWAQVREFHDEGILFAENFVPPTAIAANLPAIGSEMSALMRQYNNMVVSGVLVEDSTTGRVSRSVLGMPLVNYQITPWDHARFLRGVRLLATLHFEMGAERVILPFHNLPIARSIDDLARIEDTQRHMETLELFTVHLMGTARMGSDPRQSVVGLDGQLWDLPGAYVADASLFPTAIGVNPQIGIMALATRVAERIIEQGTRARRAA